MNIQLLTFTLNHKSCSLASLGKLSSAKHVIHEIVPSFIQEESILEVVPIATCNRLEFVMACTDADQAHHAVVKHLSNYLEHTYADIEGQSQFLVDNEAVVHLFHLVSGLESLVTGDAQILGQVKQSYNSAVEQRTVGKILHTLFQKSFAAAKKVRTQTGLGKGRVSISALAVDYLIRNVKDINTSSVAVIGAGKMGALCIKYLCDMPWKKVTLVNRTVEKCQPFADEFNIDIASLDQLDEVMAEADVVISATSADGFVIDVPRVQKANEADAKSRILIDIAMPPDIDPEIAGVEHATVVGLEDLRSIADENYAQRSAATEQAQEIIQHELDALGSWPLPIQIDTVTAMMGEYACNVLQEETAELFELLSTLSPVERDLISGKINRIAERLVLAPRRMLREAAANKLSPESVEVLDELFRNGVQTNTKIETRSEL